MCCDIAASEICFMPKKIRIIAIEIDELNDFKSITCLKIITLSTEWFLCNIDAERVFILIAQLENNFPSFFFSSSLHSGKSHVIFYAKKFNCAKMFFTLRASIWISLKIDEVKILENDVINSDDVMCITLNIVMNYEY